MTRELLNPLKNSTMPGRSPAWSGILQRKCACGGQPKNGGKCDECQKKKLQRKAMSAAGPAAPSPIVHEVLNSPGKPLDSRTRSFFEPRFGHDFSTVRVHTDHKAAQSAQAVDATAYTVGQHVVFGQEQYQPHTEKGRGLLAHELTHVVQQNRGGLSGQASAIAPSDHPLEAEAARAERGAVGTLSTAGSAMMFRKSKSTSATPGMCGGPWTCAKGGDCDIADNAIVGPMPASTWWKLEVMVDIEAPTTAAVREDTIGHTYVQFSESNGNVYTYGFYPDPAMHPSIFKFKVNGCVVHPDTKHAACVDYKEAFNLTEPQYNKALNTAKKFCSAPLSYELNTFNCTSFAGFIAAQAGKSLPAMRGKVGGVLEADNPNTLLENLKARDAARSGAAAPPPK